MPSDSFRCVVVGSDSEAGADGKEVTACQVTQAGADVFWGRDDQVVQLVQRDDASLVRAALDQFQRPKGFDCAVMSLRDCPRVAYLHGAWRDDCIDDKCYVIPRD